MKTARWTGGILGLWVVLAAFLGFGPQGNLWNDVVVGIIAVAIGVFLARASSWRGWTVAILGIWLIVAGIYLPGLREQAGLLWNNLIVGLAMAYAAFSASGERPRMPEIGMHDEPHHAARH